MRALMLAHLYGSGGGLHGIAPLPYVRLAPCEREADARGRIRTRDAMQTRLIAIWLLALCGAKGE